MYVFIVIVTVIAMVRSCKRSPSPEATLVVVLAQPAPQPEHPVSLCHGNKANTLGLVVQQVAGSTHEGLLAEAALGHDGGIDQGGRR